MGVDAYVANNVGGWQNLFTPIAIAGNWQGNYAFVASGDTVVDTSASAPAASSATATDLATAAALAGGDLNSISGLANNPAFQNGAFSTVGGQEMTLTNGTQEWLVPYYQNGFTDPTGIVLIDAATGDIDQALWNDGSLTGISISATADYVQAETSGAIDTNAVPEPSTFAMFGVGAVGFAVYAWRRKRKAAKEHDAYGA